MQGGHYHDDQGYDIYSSAYPIQGSEWEAGSEWDGGWSGRSDPEAGGVQYYPGEDYTGQPALPPPSLAPPHTPQPHPQRAPPAPLPPAGAGGGGQKDFRWLPKRGWVASPQSSGFNVFYNVLEVLAIVTLLALLVFALVTLSVDSADDDVARRGSAATPPPASTPATPGTILFSGVDVDGEQRFETDDDTDTDSDTSMSTTTMIALSVFPCWLALVIVGCLSKRRKFGKDRMSPREADELMARLRAEYIYIDCHAVNYIHTHDSNGSRTETESSRFKETVPYRYAEDHSPPSLSDVSQGGSLEVRIKEDWEMVDPGTHQVYLAAKRRVMQRGNEQIGRTVYSETTHMGFMYPEYFTITPDGGGCLSSPAIQILLIALGLHGIARIYSRMNYSRAEVVVFKTIFA